MLTLRRANNPTVNWNVREWHADDWSHAVQFPIRYYLYALMFVIFDVEVIYLFPWALVYDKLPFIAAIDMAIFILLLLTGLAYAWRKRAFEWQ